MEPTVDFCEDEILKVLSAVHQHSGGVGARVQMWVGGRPSLNGRAGIPPPRVWRVCVDGKCRCSFDSRKPGGLLSESFCICTKQEDTFSV